MVTFLFIGIVMSAPFLALLILLHLITPSQRWVYTFIAFVWVAGALVWSDHLTAASRPDYNEGPGGGLGIAFAAMITMGIFFGTVSYGIFSAWYGRRLARRPG